jgi:hypothetical protein
MGEGEPDLPLSTAVVVASQSEERIDARRGVLKKASVIGANPHAPLRLGAVASVVRNGTARALRVVPTRARQKGSRKKDYPTRSDEL